MRGRLSALGYSVGVGFGFLSSIISMLIGIVIGIRDVEGAFDLPFAISIAIAVPTLALVVYSAYKDAPRNSPAYVTWPAFASTVLALTLPIVSALLWIAFTMGKIVGRLDNLTP